MIGDSNLIISKLNQEHEKRQDAHIDIRHIQQEESHFSYIKFYHVLQENNSQDDKYANARIDLSYGQLVVDGYLRFAHPP